ncbi:MAG: hypothetical protein AABW79_03555 [Nanoarchaeota archaeon]
MISRKAILPLGLMLLVGLSVFVSAAQNWNAEYQVPIYKGWNLIYGFIEIDQLDAGSFDKSSIKAIYAFIPSIQQYAQVYPEMDVSRISLIDDDELLNTAFWVYSSSETGVDFNGIYNGVEYGIVEGLIPYNQRIMYKGWNFVGVTPDMIPGPQDTNLKDIVGNCNIVKSYFFSPSAQTWGVAPIERFQLEENSLGTSWVIKVSDNCKLGTSSDSDVPAVPNLP